MHVNENIEKIVNLRNEWEKNTLSKFIKNGESKETHETSSGIPVKTVYDPEDIKNVSFCEDLGYPGNPPFTRGVYPTMYRGRLWTMRQYAGFGDACETNRRFKYLISKGQKGLSIAFDLPTQLGYDSDNPLSAGEVGRVGVSINTLRDFEKVFEGIPLDQISTSMTINAPTPILLAMYIAVAEKQGVAQEQLRGTVQNDILKEYVARGTYIFPPSPALRITTDVLEYCSKHVPNFNTISISGYHMREAGCNAIQEVAFTLANGIAYVEEVIKREILDIDDFAPHLSFFFASHNNFFEEIAKFRAARRLWSKIMKNRFNAKKENSLKLRFHTQTAGVTLTAQQPEVNLVRVAYQALAAVLGGTQSLHTNGFDEALALPTKDSVRLSLRTQQVLAHESGVPDVVDPIGGSYYIEYLTNQIEQSAMEYIKKIDEMGGMLKAIEKGYIQREIQNNAYVEQKKIEEGTRKIVGVNSFKDEEENKISTFVYDPEIEKKTIRLLEAVKKERNEDLVQEKLEELRMIAGTSQNIMPIIIELVKNLATIQEICDVLRDEFGTYRSPELF
ncbi:MAG: methylmalonyl-CoA mutase [Promethearchaeota archaeon]|nr:MAG: methylmalonyl-CoA mutase [Candidatus Lokiarchaeota archaeon]